jgi:hypothetical protein
MKKLILKILIAVSVFYLLDLGTIKEKIVNSLNGKNKFDNFITQVTDDSEVIDDTQVTNDQENDVVEVSGGGSDEVIKETQKETVKRSPETIEYFNTVAYGREFDKTSKSLYKWNKDMKIYVDGEKPEYLMSELRKIVSELNNIIDPIDLKIVSSKSESNYVIYFGDHKTFDQKYNLYSPELLDHNWGYFELYYGTGVMYVDIYRNDDRVSHKHLLREELTQSLGLVNDSYKYPESIFYQGWTTTTEFAPIDRELIDILYNN